MKNLIIIVAFFCAGIACAVIYLKHEKAAGQPAPVAMVSEPTPSTAPETVSALKPQPETRPVSFDEPVKSAAPAVSEAQANTTTNAVTKLVDALLSAKNGREKHDLFQQLLQSGQMDAAIADLQQREAAEPNNPEIPTTIGEALLNQVRAIKESGGSTDQMGILAMQADQDFDAALKLDPQNWEANFVKASSMYYWPANPQMDNDVVQRLSGLIDQQDNLPSQPQFAQTYVVLGNEYQKIGDNDKALATWQLGLSKYPNDPTLRSKVAGGSN